MDEFNECRDKLSKLLIQEERFWKQRAKVHWYREGDENTKFFHAMAPARKKRNTVQHFLDVQGNTVSDQEGLSNVACSYFSDLFKSQGVAPFFVTDHLNVSVNEVDNANLLAPFCLAEFREAIMSMSSDPAPSPDGSNPAFYKGYWDLYGMDIFSSSCSWLTDGYFPPSINETNIIFVTPLLALHFLPFYHVKIK